MKYSDFNTNGTIICKTKAACLNISLVQVILVSFPWTTDKVSFHSLVLRKMSVQRQRIPTIWPKTPCAWPLVISCEAVLGIDQPISNIMSQSPRTLDGSVEKQ